MRSPAIMKSSIGSAQLHFIRARLGHYRFNSWLSLQPAPNFACGGWPPGANFAPINATFAEQIEQHLGLNIIMKS